jgi:serine protease Do
MEPKRIGQTKQDRGVSALIWCLSILLCMTFIACAVVSVGFLRVMRVNAAARPTPTEKQVVEEITPAPATPEADRPSAEIGKQAPQAVQTPAPKENGPQLELNPQAPGEMQLFSTIPDVVEAASGSVVGVIQYQRNTRNGRVEEYGSGSGFIVSEDGYILTNAHVVNGAEHVEVLFSDGKKVVAQVVGADVNTDIAVLKVEGEAYPALPIGDSNALRVGDYVIAIGNPLSTYELYGTVTFGIISATAREINIDGFVNTYLQTDAAINFGNSGGPLINMSGQVIGMNTAKTVTAGYDSRGNAISAEGIGFALPIQNVIEIANVILKEGNVVRPGIGVQIRTVDEESAAENSVPIGCRIEELTEGAPAEKAGLKVGDIIVKVDSLPVTSNDDVVNYVRSLKVGDTAVFTVYRDGSYLTISATVGDMNQFNN